MLGAAAAEDDGDAGSAGQDPGARSRRSSRTTLPTAVRTGILAAMPPTPEPAFAPATVAVSAGRPPRSPDGPTQPTAGDGLDLPRGRRRGLRPLRQPDLGDARERGRRAGGRGRDVVRLRDGRGHRCPRPGAARRGRRGRHRTPTTAAWRCCAGWSSRAGSRCARSTSPTPTAPRPRWRAPTWSGPSRRPTRCSSWSTSRRWPPARRRPAPCSSSTARSPPRSCSARWRPARTSWCTARRSTSPVTPTCCSASPWPARSRSSTGWSRSAAPRARSPAPSRHGWPCAGCAPCTCGWSGPRRTPRTWPPGWPPTRRVSTVHYPGLGAMVSIELDRSAEDVEAIVGATRLWVHATSLGGVESSLERRRRWAGESTDVPESLIRLSVGVEDVEDLWHDLERGPVRPRLSRPRQTGGHACCAAPHRRRHPRPPGAGPVLDPGARLVGAVGARAGDRDRPGRRRSGRHLLHAGDRRRRR